MILNYCKTTYTTIVSTKTAKGFIQRGMLVRLGQPWF